MKKALTLLALLLGGFTSYQLTAAPARLAAAASTADVYATPEAHRFLSGQPAHWRALVLQRK